MLSWRELPSGRVLGSSPVWYQTGTKVIALSEFFGSATQEHSYVSLTAIESSVDSFTASLDSKASCAASLLETFVDTFYSIAVSPTDALLSVKEDFSDTAACSSKVTDTALAIIVEQTSDMPNFSVNLKVSNSLSVKEQFSDAYEASAAVGSHSITLEAKEQAVDSLDALVAGRRLLNLSVSATTEDRFTAIAVISNMLALAIREDLQDKIDLKFDAQITSNLAFSELFQDNGNFTLVDPNFKSGEVLHFSATRLVDFEFVAQKNYIHLYSEVPSSIFIEANKQDSATLIARRS